MECETARRIHTMFEHWAARTPNADAAIDPWNRLSYGELNARANRLARHLRANGVGPGARVGICMDRGVGMIEAIFAIFKAGGAYVPMDPAYPAQRLREMVEDARPVVVLADDVGMRALAPAIAALDAPPQAIDIAAAAATEATFANDLADDVADHVADHRADADAVAYVIYTSGSTGRPKGVEVTHAAVLHLWRALDGVLFPTPQPIAATHRAAMNASLSFDVSVQGWSRLLSGDCVVVPPQSSKLDPTAMLDLLEREAVDLFDCTPAQLTGLIDAGLLQRPSLAALTVVVAGEAIPPALWARLGESDSPRFFNAYGPTEATVYATATAIRDAGPTPHIGMPLANVRIEILDETRAPVATGDVGEVYIGGAGVARGYLHRPELTAERFVADPRVAGERLYRTGDLARQREDGAIDYLGRNDFQVKIRGFRVELGEVEAAIAQVVGVRDAVALVRDDTAGGPRLIAYYRSDDGDANDTHDRASTPTTTPTTLRAALAARLPDHMLPAAYVRVAAWPQTVNGKLDRAALPAPSAQDVAAEAFAEPRSETERALASMWSELLGRDAIGRDDGFLQLGGDSLRLIQLASRIRAAFAIDLPVQALFAPRTLVQMAEAIDRCIAVERDDGIIDTGAADDGGFDRWTSPSPLPTRVPLSHQQAGLWLLERLAPTSIAYNAQNIIRIRGALDPERLRRAVARLAQRHEILRTTFHDAASGDADGEPYQIVHADAPGMFCYRELETPPSDAALTTLIETDVAQAFDLAELPLLRFALYKLAPDDFLLTQVEQHYVHDGWSMNLILRELLALYDTDMDDALPRPAAQYRDYALWQRSEAAQARFMAQATYWKRKLEGVSLELPLRTDFPRPAVPCYAGDQVRVVLPQALSRALRAFCRDEGATLFAAMQAAYRMTIAYFAGSDDFLIGSAVGNRVWRKSESMAGMFVNMIPTRCDLSGDPSYRALIERTTAELAEGYANQEAPFEWVVREAHPQREFARNPLFQTAFSTHNSPGPQLEWPEFSLKIHEVYGNRTSKFDFDAVMIPRATDDPDGITLFWEYCVALYRRETIERLHETYLRVLAQCVARPSLRMSDVEFLAPEERARLLEGGFRVAEPVVNEATVDSANRTANGASFLHAGFEAHAARAPDRPAIEDDGRVVAYGESNARANRLARHLRALGAAPDRPVALCMTRSIAAVEAVFAVAKAGGAYLPLDPMLPEERLAFVLEDAHPRILLTDRAHRDLAERILAAQSGEAAARAHIVDVDTDASLWASHAADNLDPAEIGLTPSHLAYVIYTSGSTGTPKGVLVEHRQIMAIAAGWARQYGLAPGMRHLQMANLAFDVFTADMLRALGHGGTLVFCPQEVLADPAALEARLREARIDIADFVPVVLDALVAHVDAHGRDLSFMRTIVCGSDRWSVEAADRARRVVGDGVRLLHAYGLTETSVDSACCEIAPRAADAPLSNPPQSSTPQSSTPQSNVLSIGDAVANARVLVLDTQRRPVPVGVVGELYIGGAGVARGYLARPELEAERFLDSPFHPGERLYRTGDLGRWLAEGGIEYLGRNDAQVKIRGHRVELGEIEARLRAQPGVEDAAVVLRTNLPAPSGETNDAALVAYVLPRDRAASPAFDAMHRALRTKLPAHMLPVAYVAIETWPRTANGKLDRAALPSPPLASFVATTAFLAPRTPIEEAIAEIWCDVLGRDAVGVRDDFFMLGGNSLSAMRVLVALRDLFGVGLSLRRLFEAPTIEALVEAMLDESVQDDAMHAEGAPDVSAEDTEAVV